MSTFLAAIIYNQGHATLHNTEIQPYVSDVNHVTCTCICVTVPAKTRIVHTTSEFFIIFSALSAVSKE